MIFFFASGQDLHTIDLEDFKYGGTNITSLRLVDPSNPEMQDLLRSWAPKIENKPLVESKHSELDQSGGPPLLTSAVLPGGNGEADEHQQELATALPVNMTAMTVSWGWTGIGGCVAVY